MKVKQFTGYFILIVIAIVLMYDVYAWISGGQAATISKQVIDYSFNNPAVPFLAGYVCGHLWWPLSRKVRDTDT